MKLNIEALESRDTPSGFGLYAVGAGPGGTPRVQVFDTATGSLVGDFQAFDDTFRGGVTTAVADVNGDGNADVIVGPSTGGGPRVRVIDGRAFRAQGFPQAPRNNTLISGNTMIADFFAFEVEQRGGVYVTAGDMSGGKAEVVVGAGPGGGPRVRIFDGTAITARGATFNATQAGDLRADFFAFESSFRNGVTVSLSPGTSGQVLTVAPGSGGSPRIRVLSGNSIVVNGLFYTPNIVGGVVADFFSGPSTGRGGAFVTSADFDRDGIPDVAVGTGAGVIGSVTVYSGVQIVTRGQGFTGLLAGDILDAFMVAGSSYTNGVTVGNTVETAGANNGLLFYGFGGPGVAGRSILVRYQTIFGGGVQKQAIDDITFDGSARNVFVGN